MSMEVDAPSTSGCEGGAQRRDLLESVRAPSRLSLVLTRGPAAGQTLTPKGYFLQVGRTRASKLHIKDSAVSERHAEVAWDGRSWVLKDVGSSNGTKLNGRSLLPNGGPCALQLGDASGRAAGLHHKPAPTGWW